MEEIKAQILEWDSYLPQVKRQSIDVLVDNISDLAVSKERERIVEMIEKEIDRIKNGDIKWVGLRKALKLIQNERTI